jgi:hypothetical protein
LHVKVDVLLRADFLLTKTVGEPGVHGAVVTGIQGCGVSTPWAAVVAAATCGLDKVVHMPKGRIFFMGMLSMYVATGTFPVLVLFSGVRSRLLGVVPKLHLICAFMQTNCAIPSLLIQANINARAFKPPFILGRA